MLKKRRTAEFVHLPEYQELFFAFEGEEIAQCGSHGVGIGVVGVDEDGVGPGFEELAASKSRRIASEDLVAVGRGNAE